MRWSRLPEGRIPEGRFQILVSVHAPSDDVEASQGAEIVYRELVARGFHVLLDDRLLVAEAKRADANRPSVSIELEVDSERLSRNGSVRLIFHSSKNSERESPESGLENVLKEVPLEEVIEKTEELIKCTQ